MPDRRGRGAPGSRVPPWLVWTGKLALTGLVTVFIVRRVGVDAAALGELDLASWELRPVPLVASVAALAAGYGLSASLWGRMVRELGGPRVPARTAVPLFMVANLGRYIPGKVFQIAGLAWLSRERGIPAATGATAAVLGQATALMGATLVGTAAFLSPALDPGIRLGGWIALGLTWAAVLATSVPPVTRRLEALASRILVRRTRGGRAGEGSEVEAGALRLRRAFGLRWTLLYAMNWGLYATAFWLLVLGLVDFIPFLYVAPAFAAAYVGGYVALFAPAGLGVREGLLVAFLAPVLSPEPALAVAVAARLWSTAVEVLPAALMAPGVLRRGKAA